MATVRRTMLAMIMVAGLMAGASATSFTVGDTTGWTITSSATFYQEWADAQKFNVGDDLTFLYASGHNVYEVSATDFAACSSTNTVAMYTVANPVVKLTKAGEYFFICEVAGHCDLGMKMSLIVAGNATSPSTTPAATPPSATPLTTASPPAPPPSAATGLQSSVAVIAGSLLAVGALLL